MLTRLLVKMRSGDTHLIKTTHVDIDQFFRSVTPKGIGQINWCVYKLADTDSFYDNVVFDGGQIESVKYLGSPS